jgi:hypothetical protein
MLERIEERRLQEERTGEEGDWEDVPMEVDGDGDPDSDYETGDEDEELRDIPEEFIETHCTGISDIIITGQVCAIVLLSC